MSAFLEYKEVIGEGDFVLAFIGRDNIKPIIVKKDDILNTRYGAFAHNSMIGEKYGSQITSLKGYGFIHLLHPTPELWTLSLPHRTQIVYTPDSSYIIQRLNITAGSRVIEAGTGSGSFTHSFARTLSKTGQLFTYEFHESRYQQAKAEFELHSLTNVIATCRDVCKKGFVIDGYESGCDADSIFLDLPSPWEAIAHLPQVISKSKRVGICCFSPCIEQVIKTAEALKNHGWSNIEMVEIAGRKWEARKEMIRDVSDVIGRLKDIKRRKEEGIEIRDKLQNQNQNQKVGEKRGNEDSNEKEQFVKKTRIEREEKGFNPFGKGLRIKEGDEAYNWKDISEPETEVKSHTSYLTFAFKNAPTKPIVNHQS
ncbi:hypothetical protein PACTADRAFT_2693 [Pachysolen tannophilus NRRL Y-2460]|uniref:tRNA (adenine(58)-N(1))-methyltransferase catalytic subunit TRM61 n=1 Tax=Pachysolen tannophilus NRRL Y-2460 TaxID=669874 RepID=A0A1E4TXC3_PACTA|nr:hypothetical protein PACTADRAFT_2693 [Pachysolen tannophilus NRRL Y-2460]